MVTGHTLPVSHKPSKSGIVADFHRETKASNQPQSL